MTGGLDLEPGDDDGLLVAFLDNACTPEQSATLLARLEVEPALQARLAELERGGRPFADAFAGLLAQAPVEKLLAEIDGRSQAVTAKPARRWRAGMAAAIVLFLTGAALGRFAPIWAGGAPQNEAASETDEWRDAVADYVSLYTADTFSTAMPAADQLAETAAKVELPLDPQSVSLPGLELRGAQSLNYEGQPLAEIVFNDSATGPFLLCIIKDGEADAPVTLEKRRDFSTASWAKGGRGFMLIGRISEPQISRLAEEASKRL